MKVKIKNTERLLNGFFEVDLATLQHEKFDGTWSETVKRFNLTRNDAVAVLIFLQDTNRLVLIRQFRYAAHIKGNEGWIDEIVAGVIESGETPLECAKRECIEETGYEISKFELIASAFSSPGITTELVHLYIGYANSWDKIHIGGGLAEEHEDIQLLEFSPEEVIYKLKNREFIDAKTILALQYFLNSVHPLTK